MLLITTKCLFTHACGKRLINANPCHGIMLSALLGARPPKRQRLMLTREELHLLLNAGMRRRNALTIRILLATAVRSAELYKAKWKHIDLDEARWHIPKSKTGTAMDIPLAPIVLGWFKELREMAGASAYVLPAHSRGRAARQGGNTHVSKDTIREAIGYWLDAEKPAEVPHVLGLANWSTIDGVNYARTDAPSLNRAWDFVVLPWAFLAMGMRWNDIGMVLFVPAAVAYLLSVVIVRGARRTRRAWSVDCAIDVEAWRTSRQAWALQ